MKSKRQALSLKGSIIVPALLAVFCLTGPGQAQDVANGEAIAIVMAGLSVTADQNLDFGNVLQGVAVTQDQTDDLRSGIFTILGQENAEVSMYMALPNYLATDPLGDDRMAISFDVTDATQDTSVVAGCSPAAPGAGAARASTTTTRSRRAGSRSGWMAAGGTSSSKAVSRPAA